MNKKIRGVYLFLVFCFLVVAPVCSQEAQPTGTPPGQTTLISVTPAGEAGNMPSEYPTLSADGRYLAFHSQASNLAPNDGNNARDVFVYNRLSETLTLISRTPAGQSGSGDSAFPDFSADGRYLAFHSVAGDLIAGDSNGMLDIYIYDQQNSTFEWLTTGLDGEGGDNVSIFPEISADGRTVAFYSLASNLVENDTNDTWDVFVYDRQTEVTERVSVSSSGAEGNGQSNFPNISADGRFVVFDSEASNLIANDTNGEGDVFIHDRQTGQTVRISNGLSGQQANGHSLYPVISANNRFVAFTSLASNLVVGDTNNAEDLFVYDRLTGLLTRASISSNGQQSNGASHYPVLSADGRYVVFDSEGSNLVSGDTNGVKDIFRRDRLTGVTVRISVNSLGQQANGVSSDVAISPDGQLLAFHSQASNLAGGDANGVNDVYLRELFGEMAFLPIAPYGNTLLSQGPG